GRSCALLRDEMGDGRPDPGAGAGIARGHGRHPVESGRHQYGDVAKLLRRLGVGLSNRNGMGEAGGPVSVEPWSETQRPVVDGAVAAEVTRRKIQTPKAQDAKQGPVEDLEF